MQTLLALALTALLGTPAPTPSPLDALTATGRISTLSGEVLSAGDLHGRVVLVDVWATWCAPCLAEMPTLKRLHDTHSDALRIVGVNVDSVPRRDLRQWLARKDISWPQLFDGRGLRGPLSARLKVESLPRSFLYDADGRLVATDLRGEALTRAVDTLVARSRAR
jgi:thiol-disulfide isomerase/thioredoxin